MLADTNERRTTEECYVTATSASDLTVDPNHRRPVDYVIASGLTNQRLGANLEALQDEWARCSKPRKHTEAEILAYAATIPDKKGKPDIARARTAALLAFSRGTRERVLTLRGRKAVMLDLMAFAKKEGIDEHVVSLTLTHWLAPACPVCDGRGSRRLPDAPVLGRTCHHCNGSGEWPDPAGGHKVRSYMLYCISCQESGVSKRTR